ncbi:MAG: hypothetical protein ABJG78_20315 [Cyclobacteriaceae bacterium]
MDFKSFSQKYAQEIGGQFREYDETRSVIIFPLEDGRFQTITGHVVLHPHYDREVVRIKTKVCGLNENIPYSDLLAESTNLPYAKFVTEDDFLKVEASTFLVNLNEDMIKEMITEVAHVADSWEFKITGKDIH